MNVGDYIQQASKRLVAAGIDSARLDILILLEDELGSTRASLLAHPETHLSPARLNKLNTKLVQRCSHVPLAYIRGHAPFFGRDFIVNKHTLVPRPESESILELLLDIPNLPTQPHIADIGTGSGCLGITAALEVPGAQVDLYDIDASALAVAQRNATALHANVQLLNNNVLDGIKTVYDVMLANLPYVPLAYPINAAARHEPKLALFAGDDGLSLFKAFWRQVAAMPTPPRHIITESLTPQHTALAILAKNAGYTLHATSGLAQHFIATQLVQRPR